MKQRFAFLMLSLLTNLVWAGSQCDALRAAGLQLLPRTIFDVNYSKTLQGCFAGYLPEGMPLEGGLYRFGVFRDGKLAVPFPVIEAGMDLGSRPSQYLKILAVSFNDMDGDGQRDVMVIGQNLIANGERIFVQMYWGCGKRFVFDDKADLAVEEYITNKPVINIKTVQQYIRKKKLKATCDPIAEKHTP